MTDRDLIKAELQNLQKILEAKADMCIGAGKIKMLSFANACSGALELLKAEDTNVLTKWVSVEEALPTEEGQDCWVWCRELGEPELDNWEGGRGEKAVASMGPNETREFIKSGWYYNDMQPITHWMPVDAPKVPEPPKEESNDRNED